MRLFVDGNEIALPKSIPFVDDSFDLNTEFNGWVRSFNTQPKNSPSKIQNSAYYKQMGFNSGDGTCLELAITLLDESKNVIPHIYLRAKAFNRWGDWKLIN